MFIFFTYESEQEKIKMENLFDKYQRLLLYKAYGILNDYSLAEDAVSEAFIRIYKNLGKISDIDSRQTVSFLVTIVKNTSLTLLAKRKNRDVYDSTEYGTDEHNVEETVLSMAFTHDMLKLVDELKEEIRAPFLLKYAHDLSHRQIAALLHISENNVTVRIHRAKRKLAELVRKAGYEYGE